MSHWWQNMTDTVRARVLWGGGLVLVCALLFLTGHARYGLFDVDEAIFTRATVEMRAHTLTEGFGALAMPTYNGEPRYHKPPLIYWVQDALMGVLGEDSLYAARLPSGLAALATVVLLGYGVWRLTRDALWAGVSAAALGLSLSFTVIARAATADGLLNFFSLAVALWVLEMVYGAQGKRGRRVDYGWVVSGGLAALAFLAKGPVAWLPAAVLALTLLVVRSDRAGLWQRFDVWRALALMLALLAPWVALLVHVHGMLFFYEFFVVHNVGRYATGLSNTQSSSHLYYLLVVLVGFFPWCLALPQAVNVQARGLKKRLAHKDVSRALPALALVWAVVYIGFFSFSQTKLVHYIVPAYPALAVLAGWQLARGRVMPVWGAFAGGALMVALSALFFVVAPVLQALRVPELHGTMGWLQLMLDFEWPPRDAMAAAVLALPVKLGHAFALVGVLILGAVLPLWLLAVRGRDMRALGLMGLSWGAALVVIAWGVVPLVWAYTQAPLARLATKMEAFGPQVPVVHLGVHKPSVIYMTRRPFLKLERALQLPDYVANQNEMLVLTEQDTVPEIERELGARQRGMVLAQDCEGGYCLLMVARLGEKTETKDEVLR